MPKASYALGPPAGFPRCGECIYFNNGSADICFTCAGAAVTAVSATACPVCSQYLEPNTSCSNRLCRNPSRRISRIQAIAMYADPLKYPIWALKDGKRGWGTIFGRMLLGWLDATNPNVDLIIALPTFYRSPPVEGSRPYPHTEAVISAASNEDLLGRWPFDVTDPRLVTQTAPSPKSAGGDWSAKHAAAQAKREVWQLANPDAFQGKRVLVYDDVCTTGNTLDAMAGYLIDAGAAEVSAVVMARVPWGPVPAPPQTAP